MKSVGDDAETLALTYLLRQGLKLKSRNYRSRFGEIDLILDDGGTLVFVEVRKRSSARFGGAAESISQQKQNKLRATAQSYLATLARTPACRFDAVLVDAHGEIDWLRGAFDT